MAFRFALPTPIGTPVRVYRNLHPTKPTWSIQAKVRQPGTRRHHWKVVGWSDNLVLANAGFQVYEAGLRRVLATGTKNVHAYVLGTLAKIGYPLADGLGLYADRVKYDPRRGLPYFFSPDYRDVRVDGAAGVVLDERGQVWTRQTAPRIIEEAAHADVEAQITVQIIRQYEVVLRVGAMTPADAEDLLRWKALGMKQADLDRYCAADASSYYDGEMTVVDHVGQVEEVPDVPETEEEPAHE